ncbi:DUF3823 domain-containing protein [Compostibacter hankyongensis]|uniref:DUF3823 domain-containing protein n=1 Tax=Compostibacter hankyongensis TaxID=1007089 RepID=A0ABP8FTR5_9BACT
MHYRNVLLAISVLAAFASCTKNTDNYNPPDAGIHGAVVDAITGDSLQSEQPNGFRIRLIDEGYQDATPIDFWGMADGSFENSKVFSGTYKVVPIEGAFFPADTQEVAIKGMVEVQFKVTPFLTITASAAAEEGQIVTKYRISRDSVGDKITVCKSLVSTHPTISNSIFDKAVTHDLTGTDDNEILATEFTDTLPGLEGGKTYYVRIAAATNNALNKYNYSRIIKITLP